GKLIGGQGGAHPDVLGVVALDHHVRLADGVGLVVDLLAVEIDITLGADWAIRVNDVVLRLGKHAAAAAGRVIDGHDRGQPILDRVEPQVGDKMNRVAGGEVPPGFLVVRFVELANQLFTNIAHAEIGKCR